MDESAIQWFEGTPMMAFHIANCWEEGTDVIKLVGTPNRQFDFDFAQSGKTALYEWCFELSTGRCGMGNVLNDLTQTNRLGAHERAGV